MADSRNASAWLCGHPAVTQVARTLLMLAPQKLYSFYSTTFETAKYQTNPNNTRCSQIYYEA